MLEPLPTGLFLLAAVLLVISLCQTTYLRAHKREPIVVMALVCGLLNCFSVWLLGGRYGALGAAAGYLGVMCLIVVWGTFIWFRCRARWHAN